MRTRVAVYSAARRLGDLRLMRVVLCVALLAALGYVFYREVHIPHPEQTTDFISYYTAAQTLARGGDPLGPVAGWIQHYQPGQPFIASYYVYTPLFALLLVPFTALPFTAAYTLWSVCNMLWLGGAVFAVLRANGVYPSVLETLLLTTAAALLSVIRLEFSWGQADIALLFLLSVAFWARQAGRPRLAGALLALACVIKPQLLIFTPFLLWKREWTFALTLCGAFLALLLGPYLWLGGGALREQFAVWGFWSNQYVSFIDNESPLGILARLFTVNPNTHPLVVAPWLVRPLWLLVIAPVVGAVAARTIPRPMRGRRLEMLDVSLVVTAMLLISPLTEYIYVTLAIFSLVTAYSVCSQEAWRGRRYRDVRVCFAVVWLLLCLPLQNIEYALWPRMSEPGRFTSLLAVGATPYLYVMAGLLIAQLRLAHLVTGVATPAALRSFVTQAPMLTRAWLRDARHALAPAPVRAGPHHHHARTAPARDRANGRQTPQRRRRATSDTHVTTRQRNTL